MFMYKQNTEKAHVNMVINLCQVFNNFKYFNKEPQMYSL